MEDFVSRFLREHGLDEDVPGERNVRGDFPRGSDAPMRASELIASITEFSDFDQATDVVKDRGITYFVNEFWTSKQRQANRLHEISYRACFKPQLPAFFIDRVTDRGDRVFDPFMGRGTTPLQAALTGRFPVGNDINPLSRMLVRPRLRPPDLVEVSERLDDIDWHRGGCISTDLSAFYSKTTLRQILSLRTYLLERNASGNLDEVDDWIRMVALNRLTGHSSGFFSVYTLPPNQACSIERQRKINLKREQTPPDRNVPAIILKKSKSLLSQTEMPIRSDFLLGTAPASDTAFIDGASIDLVVTSPPFLDVVQYAKDNWLRCWFAGIDASDVPISMHRKVSDWQGFVRGVLREQARIVRAGGVIAFEVGEVRNGNILLERNVVAACEGLPLKVHGVMINQQDFTKTSNSWGVANGSKGTNTNRVVIMERLP